MTEGELAEMIAAVLEIDRPVFARLASDPAPSENIHAVREGEAPSAVEVVFDTGQTFEVTVRDVTGVAPTEGREG